MRCRHGDQRDSKSLSYRRRGKSNVQWGDIGAAVAPAALSLAAMSTYAIADERLSNGDRSFRLSARWSGLLISALVLVATSITRLRGESNTGRLAPLGFAILFLLMIMFSTSVGVRSTVIRSYRSIRSEPPPGYALTSDERVDRLLAVRDADRLFFIAVIAAIAVAATYVAASIGA